MFVNRDRELERLEREYHDKGFRFSILYGRRRVGKTTLLKRYIENKPSIYFLVTLESGNIVLNRFKDIVAEFFEDPFLRDIELKDIKQLFAYISKKKLEKKVVIIIDEFQYLAKTDKSIPSQFQYIVDELIKTGNIHLILCGSIISMMYEQTLSYRSPLYGRRTSAIKLEALKFAYLREFFPDKKSHELIELYSILDGVPKYLEMFRESHDIFDAIEKNILSKDAYLYDEPRYILQNEVSEPVTYFTILETIAGGDHKIGNIAGRLGKNVQNITSFIARLIDLDILYKEVPVTEQNPQKSKKGLYFIRDNFFRFWFLYVLPYKSQLELGNTKYVLKKVEENFNEFVSKAFEEIAIEYTLAEYAPLKCGRWWSGGEEIDVVGVCEESLIVGECKYSNKKVGIDILRQLQNRARKIESKLPVKKYLLFSKSGFTDELLLAAEKENNIDMIDAEKLERR